MTNNTDNTQPMTEHDQPMTEHDTTTDTDWAFEEEDIIREEHEPHAPGGMPIGRSEYRIERLLRQESDGERFYYVETAEGHHLYAASAIEHRYEVIDVSESDTWTEQTEVTRQ